MFVVNFLPLKVKVLPAPKRARASLNAAAKLCGLPMELSILGAVSAGKLSVTFAAGASAVTALGAPYLRVFVRLLSAARSAARVAVRSVPIRLARSSLASAIRC